MGEAEEGPGQLLWRVSEFRQWAKLCPSEPEIGHALMRLVISGRDMPHACEVYYCFHTQMRQQLDTCKKQIHLPYGKTLQCVMNLSLEILAKCIHFSAVNKHSHVTTSIFLTY